MRRSLDTYSERHLRRIKKELNNPRDDERTEENSTENENEVIEGSLFK